MLIFGVSSIIIDGVDVLSIVLDRNTEEMNGSRAGHAPRIGARELYGQRQEELSC